MKKFILDFILGFILGIFIGITLIITNIEIDGVNEIDNGIITLKIGDQYLDYEYDYNESLNK